MKGTEMKILVIGATGGSGRAVTAALLSRGHTVTALARRATRALDDAPRLVPVDGDATDAAFLDRLLPGHDAVVITLGISEPTLRVRLRGPQNTVSDIRSRGTRAALAAARRHGIARVVVQSSYGVGPTRSRLGAFEKAFFALMIRPQIADTEVQERDVRASDADWTIVQPVFLSDDETDAHFVSVDGSTRAKKVSRRAVAEVHADLVEQGTHVRETVSVSG
jgi:uncharacterized protein YbjT (DUF2867 family)